MTRLLWLLVALYATARLTQAFPEQIPILVIVTLHVLPPLVFALIHGTKLYGLRGFSLSCCCA